MEIEFNPDLEREIALKYFRFESAKNRGMIVVYSIVFAFGVFLFSMGLYSNNPPLAWTGIAIFAFPMFLFFRWRLQKWAFLKQMGKQSEVNKLQENNSIFFSFDEEQFTVTSNIHKSELKWTAVKRFEENDGDLYLYSIYNDLLNIISEQKIGKEHYLAFREHLISGQKKD